MSKSPAFKHAGLGGTFDHLHLGHQALIQKALETAETVSIGITTDQFTKSQAKTLSGLIEPYRFRLQQVRKFLHRIAPNRHINLFPLADAVGPTLTDNSIDCLVCTNQTLPGMEAINRLRRQQALPQLPIIKADLIKDASGLYISSTRIRQGLIDSQGYIYLHNLPDTIVLSPDQRDQCIKPFGQIISLPEIPAFLKKTNPPFIAVVGDQSLANFLREKLPFDLGLFDNRIQRQVSHVVARLIAALPLKPVVTSAINPPGSISFSAVSAIEQAVKSPPGLLEIEGEEDLLVIPLILALPLQSLVFYGQPHTGQVVVTVTPKLKQKVVTLITT